MTPVIRLDTLPPEDDLPAVTVLRMDAGENWFDRDFAEAFATAVIEAAAGAEPLVVTGTDRFFSNGYHGQWAAGAPEADVVALFRTFHMAMRDLLRYPAATVAALNGHAFGLGVILACACDQRIMRTGRGLMCVPAVDLGYTVSPALGGLLRSRLPLPSLEHLLYSGARLAPDEALAHGLVSELAPVEDLVVTARRRLAPFAGKPAGAVAGLRMLLHGEVATSLERMAGSGYTPG